MKKFITVTLTILLLFSICSAANATDAENNYISSIEYLANGDYIETVINEVESVSKATKTSSKTKSYKNASGNVMWSVTVKATFNYTGSSSTCTSCSRSTTCPGASWSILSSSCSKSGNSATAKATARYRDGIHITDYSKSVTIKCSPSGAIS